MLTSKSIQKMLLSNVVRMTNIINGLTDEQLSVVGTQYKPNEGQLGWLPLIGTSLTILAAAAIWTYRIEPDDKSPNTLMVEPADELLSSFVQPAPDVMSLSRDLGFKVMVPDLTRLGASLTTVGESQFGGRPAAVVEYKLGYGDYLLYSFSQNSNLLKQMRKVDCSTCSFYVTSGGSVSVVVWKDRVLGYRALAAKVTEQDLLKLAENVARIA